MTDSAPRDVEGQDPTTMIAVGVLMYTRGQNAGAALQGLERMARRGGKPIAQAAQVVIDVAVMGCELICDGGD